MERSERVEISPNCQRCGSTNTKFCYYNNYSLTQPRYFCKECRRYWTKGGSLRNVPVGGACKKNHGSRAVNISSYHQNQNNKSLLSCAGSSSSSNIDLAIVYANFLKQDMKQEAERVDKLIKNDSFVIEMGDSVDGVSFELPEMANGEGMMTCRDREWCDERDVSRIQHYKFTNEIMEISHFIDNWSSFDFST